jgi:lipopolysaccharide assembly protein A
MIFVFAILGVIALVIVVLFSVQNAMPVTVWFYNWRFDASLAIVVFLSALAGMVIETLFVVSLRLGKSVKRKVRKTSRPEEGTTPRGENMGHMP